MRPAAVQFVGMGKPSMPWEGRHSSQRVVQPLLNVSTTQLYTSTTLSFTSSTFTAADDTVAGSDAHACCTMYAIRRLTCAATCIC